VTRFVSAGSDLTRSQRERRDMAGIVMFFWDENALLKQCSRGQLGIMSEMKEGAALMQSAFVPCTCKCIPDN